MNEDIRLFSVFLESSFSFYVLVCVGSWEVEFVLVVGGKEACVFGYVGGDNEEYGIILCLNERGCLGYCF